MLLLLSILMRLRVWIVHVVVVIRPVAIELWIWEELRNSLCCLLWIEAHPLKVPTDAGPVRVANHNEVIDWDDSLECIEARPVGI
jgi:hypothetical protein